MRTYKPRKGSAYWMINSRFEVKETTNTGSKKSLKRINVGNCFKTKQEANAFAYLVREGALGKFTGFKRRSWWRQLLWR